MNLSLFYMYIHTHAYIYFFHFYHIHVSVEFIEVDLIQGEVEIPLKFGETSHAQKFIDVLGN